MLAAVARLYLASWSCDGFSGALHSRGTAANSVTTASCAVIVKTALINTMPSLQRTRTAL